MSAWINEWAQLLFRWVHVLAAIAWIGHAFFFHSMEKALRKPEVDGVDPDVHGELWMVHGGGFFRMQKTRVLPPVYTGHLHWFKYEALLTWVSGFLLLIALYYLTGGIYMVDRAIMELQLDPEEAYQGFMKTLQNVNVVIATYNDPIMGELDR